MKDTQIDTKIIFAAAHIEARKGDNRIPYSYRFKEALNSLYFAAKWQAGAKEVCNPDFFAWCKLRFASIISCLQKAQIAANDAAAKGDSKKSLIAYSAVNTIGKKLEAVALAVTGKPLMYISFLDTLASSSRPIAAYYR